MGDITMLHASCVAIQGRGVLLLGPSGAGKSDLALRLIDRGAVLVADDQVELRVQGQDVLASAPASLKGLLEVRGVGVVHYPLCEDVPIVLAVTLVSPEQVERLPLPQMQNYCGKDIPHLHLNGRESSVAVKVELALHVLVAGGMQVGAFKL